MCLLLVSHKAKPSQTLLDLGDHYNPHGIGIAYRKHGKVYIEKAIKMDQLQDILHKEKGPYVIHFRWASAGGNSKQLTHPFAVDKRASENLKLSGVVDSVIAHNGHIDHWEHITRTMFLSSNEPVPEGPWSDTRMLSYAVAKNGPNILSFWPGQRLVYMNATHLKVFNKDLFTAYKQEDGEVWSSQDVITRKKQEEERKGFEGMPGLDEVEIEFTGDMSDDDFQTAMRQASLKRVIKAIETNDSTGLNPDEMLMLMRMCSTEQC